MGEQTYEEIIAAIENKRRFGNLAGVELTGRMLSTLHDPQAGMDIIHIAGTNGKGSVSAFLCEILQAAGLRVGMFTSPHLVDFRERIRINGEMIPKEDVRRIGSALLDCEFGVHPTMFDYCLVMALLYFKEQDCDVIILETGLGGKLDSTNAVATLRVGVPKVSVITKIGYDHMAILGGSLEQIASEKAGIIKKGTHLVVESQKPEVLRVFLDVAKQAGVKECQVVDTKEIRDCRYEDGEQIFSYRNYGNLRMKMLGVHQYENAVAAILAAEAYLTTAGRGRLAAVTAGETAGAAAGTAREIAGAVAVAAGEIAGASAETADALTSDKLRKCVYQGILRTKWQGRMEILREDPFLLADGAHNSNGVEALRESLTVLFPGEKFHFIMGVMADKDYEKMIEALLPLAIDFKTVTVRGSRALVAEDLAECIRKKGVSAEACGDFKKCLRQESCDRGHKTVAFGSLYFIGEIEELFL